MPQNDGHSRSPWYGRTALITGASSGLGFEVAYYLTALGFRVFGTTRDICPNPSWRRKILTQFPRGNVTSLTLDLGSLGDVAKTAQKLSQEIGHLDLLVNNAGIMAPLHLGHTEDGHEQQFGVNYLAHFALTYHLRGLLRDGTIVNVSSLAATRTNTDFSMVKRPQEGDRWPLYQKSKLAQLLFSQTLYRKAKKYKWPLHVRAAHPGWACTSLVQNRLSHANPLRRYCESWIARAGLRILGQSAAHGAMPILYAALAHEAKDGRYYGPRGWGEHRGFPTDVPLPRAARDITAQDELWRRSEELTGCYWPSDSNLALSVA